MPGARPASEKDGETTTHQGKGTRAKCSGSGRSAQQHTETARMKAAIGLRDPKNLRAGHLAIPAAAFAALLTRIKNGGPAA